MRGRRFGGGRLFFEFDGFSAGAVGDTFEFFGIFFGGFEGDEVEAAGVVGSVLDGVGGFFEIVPGDALRVE